MKRFVKFIVIGVVVLAISLGVVYKVRSSKDNGPIIKTAKVERGTVVSSVSATGTLQPLTTVDVKSKAGGKVVLLAVDVGDEVKPGQLIAKIDPTDTQAQVDQAKADLEAAKARLEQAQETMRLQEQMTKIQIEQAEQSLLSAKTKLEQIQKEIEVLPIQRKAALSQAEANYRSAVENLNLLKNATHPQVRAQAQAAYDQAKANLENAKRNLDRLLELSKKGFVTQSQVESAQREYEVAKAQFDSAKRKLDTLESELDAEIKAAEARVEQARASLETARAEALLDELKERELEAAKIAVKQAELSLAQAKANAIQNKIKAGDIQSAKAQVQRAQAQFENAMAQLESTVIRAPRAGVILKKYVEEGTIITSGMSAIAQGTNIVQIGDLSRVFVDVTVDETDIGKVEVGQPVDITIDAFPDEIFEGKVTKIEPQAVMEQNVVMVHVRVEIENPDARLKPGMSATCEFIIDKKEDVLCVPNQAVKEKGGRNFVTVVKNGRQEDREVQIGLVGNDLTEIVKGLKEGEEVITSIIQTKKRAQTFPQTFPMGGPGMGPPRR
jgi:HlyD family secretion protein